MGERWLRDGFRDTRVGPVDFTSGAVVVVDNYRDLPVPGSQSDQADLAVPLE